MKTFFRLLIVFVIAAVVAVVIQAVKRASEPQSAIIAQERNKLSGSIDKSRAEKDPAYAREMGDKLRFLDYRTALAYNSENKPDEAIAILQKLINGEQARGAGGGQRYSRSYFDEARYYDAIKESYELKNDAVAAQNAAEMRKKLLAQGEELSRREAQEEGESLGSAGE